MSHNIFYDVRYAIQKIHQYDVTTAVKGEELDNELKEVNEACSNLRAQIPELRKKKYESESFLEEANMKMQMAKRAINHKIAIVSCLEAETERLDQELTKQEEEAQCYLDATKEDPISNIIESFKGMKVEKETELDDVCSESNKLKNLNGELEESIKGLKSKDILVQSIKADLETKCSNHQCLLNARILNKRNMDEMMTGKANMSGELQFMADKFEEMQKAVNQVKASVLSMRNAEDQVSKDITSRSDDLAQDHHKYDESQISYNQKLMEVKALENEQTSLHGIIDELKSKATEVNPKKKEFSEISDLSDQLKEKVAHCQLIEQDVLNLKNRIGMVSLEQEDKDLKYDELNQKIKLLLNIETEVAKNTEDLSNLTDNRKVIREESNEISVMLEDLDMRIDECKQSLLDKDQYSSNITVQIDSLDKEIDEIVECVKEIAPLEEEISIRKEKMNAFENEIQLLGNHESHVNSTIQEQGGMEADRIMNDINQCEHETNQLLANQNDLDLKKIQNEETFNSNLKSIKDQREDEINQAVETGIQNIEAKLKENLESRRKEMKPKLTTNLPNGGKDKKESSLKSIISSKIAKKPQITNELPVKTSKAADAKVNKSLKTTSIESPKANDIKVSEKKDIETSKYKDMETDSDSDPFEMSDASQSEPECSKPIIERKPPVHSCIDSNKSPLSESGPSNPNTPSRFKRFLNTKSNSSDKSKMPSKESSISKQGQSTINGSSKPTSPGSITKTSGSGRVRKILMPQTSKPSQSNEHTSSMPKTPGSVRVRKTLQTTSNGVSSKLSKINSMGFSGTRNDVPSHSLEGKIPEAKENMSSDPKTPGSRREKKILVTKRA